MLFHQEQTPLPPVPPTIELLQFTPYTMSAWICAENPES